MKKKEPIYILGIESSCDDTSAAVIRDTTLLSNIIANQKVHEAYGGVVPELASRSHQKNIVPVVQQAVQQAGISKNDLDAIAYTQGPGLLGSLLVGSSFAKGLSASLNIPMIGINHLHGHVLSPFIDLPETKTQKPQFPFLCLLVSGGNSQIIKVDSPAKMTILGQTIDDAAGEAFDKCGKMLGLPYPAGPIIDKYAAEGNPKAFAFAKPKVPELDYSFSGLKTSVLYFLRKMTEQDSNFISNHIRDISASLQMTIIDILLHKLIMAVEETGITEITTGGGVSANSGLRNRLQQEGENRNWNVFLPPRSFTTDNAAMIAIVGRYKLAKKDFGRWDDVPYARVKM